MAYACDPSTGRQRPSGLSREALSQVKEQNRCLFFVMLSTEDSHSGDHAESQPQEEAPPAPLGFSSGFYRQGLALRSGRT